MIHAPATAAAVVLAMLSAPGLRADLAKAKAEANLDRRARLALDNAAAAMRSVSQFYRAGDWDKTAAALAEVNESVVLAYASLRETNRNPRNSSQFKNLEIKTRELLRNLEDFRQTLSLEEREKAMPVVDNIRKIHDEVLNSVMGVTKWSPKR